MFVPARVIDWFTSLKNAADTQASLTAEALAALREELAATRAERDALKLQAAVDRTHFDWLRTKINALEFERSALIEKAYNIKLPTPELVRPPSSGPNLDAFNFEDVGDRLAKELGFPSHEE